MDLALMDLDLSAQHNADLRTLYSAIFSRCQQASTGTIFVVTAENRSAQVVIHKGQLIGIAYGSAANEQALRQLITQESLRHSFTPELIFPVTETLLPENARQLLKAMGFQEQPQASEPPSARGAGQRPSRASQATAAKAAKPVRIYRGQIVG